MNLALACLPLCIPPAACWVAWHEREILRHGIPLSAAGLEDAARMGVAHPERVRLMKVDRIPLLNGWGVRKLSQVFPAVSAGTVGLSLRYGIYLRARHWGDRQLIAHECVHTAQYERLGGIREFLAAYFTQCLESGYPDAPLEQEAILRSAALPDREN
jgi:hypothetical protein